MLAVGFQNNKIKLFNVLSRKSILKWEEKNVSYNILFTKNNK